jgi:hypothetical protein
VRILLEMGIVSAVGQQVHRRARTKLSDAFNLPGATVGVIDTLDGQDRAAYLSDFGFDVEGEKVRVEPDTRPAAEGAIQALVVAGQCSPQAIVAPIMEAAIDLGDRLYGDGLDE